MPSITLPRIPLNERRRTVGASDVTPPVVGALEEPVAQLDEDLALTEQQRTRRVATFIAVTILLSAVVSGVATVLARRSRQQRASSAASAS